MSQVAGNELIDEKRNSDFLRGPFRDGAGQQMLLQRRVRRIGLGNFEQRVPDRATWTLGAEVELDRTIRADRGRADAIRRWHFEREHWTDRFSTDRSLAPVSR